MSLFEQILALSDPPNGFERRDRSWPMAFDSHAPRFVVSVQFDLRVGVNL